MGVTVEGFSLFIAAFYDLGYISCVTVADLYIVSIENFCLGTVIGEVPKSNILRFRNYPNIYIYIYILMTNYIHQI